MSSLSCLNGSFIKSDNATCDEQDHGVDLKTACECFDLISKIEHPSLLDTVCRSLRKNLNSHISDYDGKISLQGIKIDAFIQLRLK